MALVGLLVGVGIIMVQSAGQVTAIAAGGNPLGGVLRQGAYALIGMSLALVISQMSLVKLRRLAWPLLLAGLVLQLLVYTPLGYEAGGNRNWLRLGPISAQPAEFMKFVLLLWVSTVLAAKRPLLGKWKHVVIPILPVVAASMCINVLGGDLGTLVIIAALVFGCLYFVQVKWRILGAIAVVAVLGIVLMTLIKPNRVFRVAQFFEIDCLNDPEHAAGMCWQSLNGFWALANGGLFGSGIGNSRAKWQWLPEAETDFIFAIVGEEVGLLGAMTLILVFVAICIVLVAIMARCTDVFSVSVMGGAVAWFGTQMVVNVSVVLGFVPVLGVPLPFVSAGGTSLISGLMAVGLVLACVRDQAARDQAARDQAALDQAEPAPAQGTSFT
ncbi:cell division protein FtsW [Leucobacter insecticola]|uniref:Probable peptidoglycan glycosyltransferase FtsW n=1 Tax=Leucobacter insecticola TaxID=2714934 RepID=A0A6G8FIQ3_9MICO|nr:putative peptidoglycan glycosyltransferase FtsW [Leucobacter insecticola]QIM16169.1 cell division protein FtsW [Leucobacter insecticola]